MIQESLVRVEVTDITIASLTQEATRTKEAITEKEDTAEVSREKAWDLRWERNATTMITTNNNVQIILLCVPLKMKWLLS